MKHLINTDKPVIADITHARLSRVLRGPDTRHRDDGMVEEALTILEKTLGTIDRLQGHIEQMLAIAEKAAHMADPMKRINLSDAFAESCRDLDAEIENDKRKNFSLLDSGLGILAFDIGTHKTVHVSVPHINLTSNWKGLCLMPHITSIRRSESMDEVIDGLGEALRKLDHARSTYQGSIAWLKRHR